MHTFLSKVLQYNDKSGLNKKSFIYANAISVKEVDETKKDARRLDHRKFIDVRNFITDCVEYKPFQVFTRSGALSALLGFLKDVLTHFIENPLPTKFSDKFRIITVQNENVLDDMKYRIIFLLQLKLFLHSLEHRLAIHKDAYPEFDKRDKRVVQKINEMAESILRLQKIQSSKRSIADAFGIFEHFENININWKNEGCPSFEFVSDEPDAFSDGEVLAKRELTRRGGREKQRRADPQVVPLQEQRRDVRAARAELHLRELIR